MAREPATAERNRRNGLWVTWERHRRSRELADALDVPVVTMVSGLPYLPRILLLGLKTVFLLIRRRPRLLFVQNPSLALAALACVLKPLCGYALVVDRHSNFVIRTLNPSRPVKRIFDALSRFTVRRADLTIVTNSPLRDLAAGWGGRGFVLEDRLPDLGAGDPVATSDGADAVFICTFSSDEPVAAVIEAARLLPHGVTVHITGDSRRCDPGLVEAAPPNVRFTGFLPEREYVGLLRACDLVLALTDRPHTMLCGAYEAVSAGKPMVISNHRAMTGYFSRGAFPTDNSPADIAASITAVLDHAEGLAAAVAVLKTDLERSWRSRFAELEAELDRLPNNPDPKA